MFKNFEGNKFRVLGGAAGAVLVFFAFQNCQKFQVSESLTQQQNLPGITTENALSPSALSVDSNAKGDLSKSETYFQSSLLMEFQRNGNADLLKQFFQRVDAVLSLRDDAKNRYSKSPTWSFESLYDLPKLICSDSGMDGMILTPWAEFLTLYSQRKDLFKDVESTLDVSKKAAQYAQAIRQVLDYHGQFSWNDLLGTYKANKDCAMKDAQGRTLRDLERQTFNQIAAIARVQFRLYLYDSNAADLQKVLRIAKDLKNWFKTGTNGELSWPYFYADLQAEDSLHGAIVLDFIRLLAEHGVVFDSTTLSSLEKTVKYQIFGTAGFLSTLLSQKNIFYSIVQCFSASAPPECRAMALWLPVVSSKEWTDYIKIFVPILGGSFDKLAESYLATYVRNKTAGQPCTQDGQCSSGSCYANKVCGIKLAYGLTCTKDSECTSGLCYGGAICVNSLGLNSACTRHHECTSGLCSGGFCKTY